MVYHDPVLREDRLAVGDTLEEAITNVLSPGIIPEEPEISEEIEEVVAQLRAALELVDILLDKLDDIAASP